MKQFLTGLIFLASIGTTNAIGVKMYVAGVDKVEGINPHYKMQLIVCNNRPDTIYISRRHLEMIFPTVSNDLSDVVDGKSYLFMNYVPNLMTDQNDLLNLTLPPDRHAASQAQTLDADLAVQNDKIPQKEIDGEKYFMFEPNKCITLNSMAQIVRLELFKLIDITKEQEQEIEINLVTPVNFFRNSETKNVNSMLLISRASDELKNALLDKRPKR